MSQAQEENTNLHVNQLFVKNKDGSIPLINFMKNTEIFIRKYELLSHRVQEIEKRVGIENIEKIDISKMKPISFYFPPVNLVEKKKYIIRTRQSVTTQFTIYGTAITTSETMDDGIKEIVTKFYRDYSNWVLKTLLQMDNW